VARLRHLVVVIPGIGGSILAAPEGDGGGVRYELSARGLAGALLRPGLLDLGRFPELVPVGLVSDFTVLPPLVTLPGYQRLVHDLGNSFDNCVISTYAPPVPVPATTDVLLFPYDFRRSVADAAERLDAAAGEALAHRSPAPDDRPVIIVAHSMGGLVARYWIGVLGGWRRCHALVTLGTPYRGAPKALDWLVNGAGAGRLRDPRITRVIREWPSVHELLPQYEAVCDHAGGGAGQAAELTVLPTGLVSARPELAGYAPRFAEMAAAGRKVHEAIRDGWLALDPGRAPEVTAFMGRGHPTLGTAILDGGGLRVTKDDPSWRGNTDWHGDGTVPMLSAIPHEQGGRPGLWRVMPDRHGPLGSVPEPVRLLELYAGDPVPVRGGELPERPWLGLDIEEFVTAGAETPVGIRLLPEPIPGDTAAVTLSPHDPGVAGPVTGRLERAGPGTAAWQGTLPGRPAGVYELAAEVRGVPGWGTVTATADIVVLGGSGEGDG
jgi:hypothetical protein